MNSIIEIPSVINENCIITLKFDVDSQNHTNIVSLDCTTPNFKAKLQSLIDEKTLNVFIDDLSRVENERKGFCQIYDEWRFSLTIRSIDLLGHFRVEMWMQDKRDSAGADRSDELKIGFEIEPSLLTTLKHKFKELILQNK